MCTDEYLGVLLDYAGKMYFAQVDIENNIMGEQLNLTRSRDLSVGMTGYRVTPVTMNGVLCGIEGGTTSEEVLASLLVNLIINIGDLSGSVFMANSALEAVGGYALLLFATIFFVWAMIDFIKVFELWLRYTVGDEQAGIELKQHVENNVISTIVGAVFGALALATGKLIKKFGAKVLHLVTTKGIATETLSKINRLVQKGLNNDLTEKLLDNPELYEKYSDDVWMLFKGSDKSADDIIRCLDEYADEFIENYKKHGDKAVDAYKTHGKDADSVLNGGGSEGGSDVIKNNLVNKVKDIRAKMPNTNLAKRGNMVVADVDVPGIKDNFVAHSKINAELDKGADVADFSYLKPENERIFTSYVDDQYPRYHDTEAKILEDIASQITDPNVSGTINLYSELPSCQSCSNIILEFRRMFPNIELNIFVE